MNKKEYEIYIRKDNKIEDMIDDDSYVDNLNEVTDDYINILDKLLNKK